MEVIDDDAADAGIERLYQLLARFVVAVEVDALGWEAGAQRHVELAAGDHVQIQPLLIEDLCDGGAQVGLRGVGGLGGAGVVPRQGLPVGAARARSVSSSKT